MKQDLEVTGPIRVMLFASSSALDTDFTAKLVDVFPNGEARNLTDGILRMRYRESLEKAELAEPSKVYPLVIDAGVTSNVFLAGHSIRVEISSSNFPRRFDRNPNRSGPIADETVLKKAEQMVYHSRQYPSRVLLPVIPENEARRLTPELTSASAGAVWCEAEAPYCQRSRSPKRRGSRSGKAEVCKTFIRRFGPAPRLHPQQPKFLCDRPTSTSPRALEARIHVVWLVRRAILQVAVYISTGIFRNRAAMRTLLITSILIAAPGTPVALLAAPVTYDITFAATQGIAPAEGSFAYDGASQSFSNFEISWQGVGFDLTASANAPTIAGTVPCLHSLNGPAATFAAPRRQMWNDIHGFALGSFRRRPSPNGPSETISLSHTTSTGSYINIGASETLLSFGFLSTIKVPLPFILELASSTPLVLCRHRERIQISATSVAQWQGLSCRRKQQVRHSGYCRTL